MTNRFSDLLPVEPLGDDRFVVRPYGSGFLFGGLSLAMVLRTAAETVDSAMAPMSLRATFLSNGDWGGPHHIKVSRVSDSRSFAVRRVDMVTNGKLAIVAEAIFQHPEAGDDWQAAAAPASWPPPETLDPLGESVPVRVIDVRPLRPAPPDGERVHPYWARTLERLDNPTLLACAMAFISDYWVVATPFPASSSRGAGLMSRTLTHSLVFHRPLPAEGWWLFDCDPLSVSGGRFLSRGAAQGPDGALLASFVQEGVIRPAR
jgi:acyl-CoA thioesterase II